MLILIYLSETFYVYPAYSCFPESKRGCGGIIVVKNDELFLKQSKKSQNKEKEKEAYGHCFYIHFFTCLY